MKINLSKRKIEEKKRLDIKDIPLAYIDTNNVKYTASFSLNEDFGKQEKKAIRPYDNIENESAFFFDKNNNILTDIVLKRLGNRYVFEPKNTIEFAPETFSCYANIKKNMKYKDANSYNIKIAVGEEDENLTISNNLIKIFGDSNRRGICPYNIKINDGAMTPQSLLQTPIKDCDFVFISSEDGVTLPNNLNINAILDQFTNVWLMVDEFDGMFIAGEEPVEKIKEGHLCSFYKKTERKNISERIFNQTLKSIQYYDLEHYFLYEDVLVLEKEDKGFIIVTPKEFFDNVGNNAKIIYDVMMYVFFQSYYKTKTIFSWITNRPVEYTSYTNEKIDAFHKKINLKELIKNNYYEIDDNEYSLLQINTDNENVSFVSMDKEKNLFFRKNESASDDPKKEKNQISYLTPKNTIMHYEPENIYYLKTVPILEQVSSENNVKIKISQMHDSEKQINTNASQTLTIPDTNIKYKICTKKSEPEIQNIFYLIDSSEYSIEKHGFWIAEVSISQQNTPQLHDIRVFGGGLQEDEENNYNLIDIGNVYGRPIRKGSTLIFKLPKECEQYEEIILPEIKKHITAGEYIVMYYA